MERSPEGGLEEDNLGMRLKQIPRIPEEVSFLCALLRQLSKYSTATVVTTSSTLPHMPSIMFCTPVESLGHVKGKVVLMERST